jgi:hypothetical protein
MAKLKKLAEAIFRFAYPLHQVSIERGYYELSSPK